MKRLFVIGIVLTMVMAGVLVSLSANTFEDTKAESADKVNSKLSDAIRKIKDRDNEASE